jgi:hypothetical protein
MTIAPPKVHQVESSEFWRATGTLGNQMQEDPTPALFDNAFSQGLTGLGEKAAEAIGEVEPEERGQP